MAGETVDPPGIPTEDGVPFLRRSLPQHPIRRCQPFEERSSNPTDRPVGAPQQTLTSESLDGGGDERLERRSGPGRSPGTFDQGGDLGHQPRMIREPPEVIAPTLLERAIGSGSSQVIQHEVRVRGESDQDGCGRELVGPDAEFDQETSLAGKTNRSDMAGIEESVHRTDNCGGSRHRLACTACPTCHNRNFKSAWVVLVVFGLSLPRFCLQRKTFTRKDKRQARR